MSKKDYVLIASIIKKNREYSLITPAQKKAIDNLAFDLSHSLRLDNLKFNDHKFLTACGIK